MTGSGVRRGRFIAGVIASLALAACGGGGGGGGGGGDATAGASSGLDQGTAPGGSDTTGGTGTTSGVKHALFVTDTGNSELAVFDSLTPGVGSSLSGSVISVTQLKGAIAYDGQRDLLYVASAASVLVFAGASTMAANSTPTRTISLGSDFLWVNALRLDATADVLMVSGERSFDSQLLVIEQASTASGAAAPARTMTFNDHLRDFAVDTSRAILYGLTSAVGVHVYTGIDTATGVQQPSRHMLQNLFSTQALALDATSDRLYVTDTTAGVHIVDNASTTPVATVTLALANAYSVALDAAHDTLYVGAYDKAYVVAGPSHITGATTAPAASLVASSGTAIGGFAFA